MRSTRRAAAVFDWMFRDREADRIVVGQVPNVALWTFLASVVLRWIFPTGTTARTVVDWIGVVALAWWALDELLRGVNPWRRLLGVAGCDFVVAGAWSLLRGA